MGDAQFFQSDYELKHYTLRRSIRIETYHWIGFCASPKPDKIKVVRFNSNPNANGDDCQTQKVKSSKLKLHIIYHFELLVEPRIPLAIDDNWISKHHHMLSLGTDGIVRVIRIICVFHPLITIRIFPNTMLNV